MVKTSVYKSSTSSIQNAVLMLLFVIGMFVMYRYVKTIETETKLLQNHMIELSQKLQSVVSNQEDCRALLATMGEGNGAMMGGMCPMPTKMSSRGEGLQHFDTSDQLSGSNENDDMEEEGGYEQEDCEEDPEDNQSVQSGEITNILRQVIGNAMDMEDQLPSTEDVRNMKCSLEQIEEAAESAKVVMNIDDDGDEEQEQEEEDEFTEEKLYKRTNDDLKTICREMDLSTKGTKADLVARIMQS